MDRRQPEPVRQNTDLPYDHGNSVGYHPRPIFGREFGWCDCGRRWDNRPPLECPDCGKRRNEDDPRIEER